MAHGMAMVRINWLKLRALLGSDVLPPEPEAREPPVDATQAA